MILLISHKYKVELLSTMYSSIVTLTHSLDCKIKFSSIQEVKCVTCLTYDDRTATQTEMGSLHIAQNTFMISQKRLK